MRKLWSLFGRVLELGSILSFLGLVGVVLLQVYARLFLPKSPHWTEEASRFLFIYTVSFASGLAIREKAFVNVDVFTNMLPKPVQRWLQILLDLLVAGFMAVVFYYSLKNLGIGRMQTSASLRIPMHYIFASMSILSGTVVLYSLASVVRDVRLAAGGGD
ncbi:MAG: TRAP transporter small permease [Synergistales bacterium]|jgi:TRAP-type C4-dicarboxylate transport system permease small subunit|uniref:TRAP transporter small permease n=1 Tax=Aminivibrio sp. TaxID=1872489 RepID=UPI001A47C1D6|nr:TRAP transporter small permease [Aminivibrio sp.]MBL3539347.1 TRAP transporter small permease [Aminivibrio sp.]MDK2959617.1 TRAP-type transport system small permease protein [Synergistaceae bacterium]NCB15443.1 TRAP transporter small permease [Synergistales bacterium]